MLLARNIFPPRFLQGRLFVLVWDGGEKPERLVAPRSVTKPVSLSLSNSKKILFSFDLNVKTVFLEMCITISHSRRNGPDHCTGHSTLTPSPHSWQVNASMTGETAKHLGRSATRTQGARDFHRHEFHQPRAGVVDGNGIGHAAARVANEIGHFTTFLDHGAAVPVRASGDFMRDDQVAALVLGHAG
jgi:hypothetical protein